jgi:hypothetical protein
MGDRTKLAEAFKLLSGSIPKLITAIKKGATAENMIQQALDSIRSDVNKLNTQSIFAQAGQLELSRGICVLFFCSVVLCVCVCVVIFIIVLLLTNYLV